MHHSQGKNSRFRIAVRKKTNDRVAVPSVIPRARAAAPSSADHLLVRNSD